MSDGVPPPGATPPAAVAARALRVLSVEPAEKPSWLKVAWRSGDGDEGRGYQYFVSRDWVEKRAETSRGSLRKLVAQIRDPSGGSATTGLAIKKLAEAGRELHDELFNAESEHQYADDSREWLAESGPTRIHVEFGDGVNIPWPLLYTGDASRLTEDVLTSQIIHFEDFWCLKHSVSATNGAINPRRNKLIAAGDLAILPALHPDVLARVLAIRAGNEPILTTAELDAVRWMNECGPAQTRVELRTRWKKLAGGYGIIYLLGHASGSRFAISKTEFVEDSDFRSMAGVFQGGRTGCLIFLNGCDTATGAQVGGFTKAIKGEGYGFVGTEEAVPDVFAVRFGVALLCCFLSSGKPLYEVMDKMRRDHWPMSLLYSLCAYPMLRVAQDPEKPWPVGPNGINFSSGPWAASVGR